jgi:hypothetical protein
MPDSDMLNSRVLSPNLRNEMLESLRKSFRLSFKFDPSVLKLAISPVVD